MASHATFDLDAYRERIGITGTPELAEVHRAHATSIPFENLDPQRGVAVDLDQDALQRKLVAAGRGGYCFEQNLLLALALRALGAEVELMLGRVRLSPTPAHRRPRSHLVLRVRAEGSEWLADVGFGAGTLLEPIPFDPGHVHEQSGWRFRVLSQGDEHVLQTEVESGWRDLYGFRPEAVPIVDVETSNWYTATHPESRFVTGLIVTAHRHDGSHVSLSDWAGELTLVHRTATGGSAEPVARDAVPQLLEEHFGLGGFTLNAAGRPVPQEPA